MTEQDDSRTLTTSNEPRDARWLLAIWPGGAADRELPEEGIVTIGRGDTCDFVLPHASVSRRHAALHVSRGGTTLHIEDLGSANGTKVGGRKLAPNVPTSINAGEAIVIGDVSLLVRGLAEDQRDVERELIAVDPAMRRVVGDVARLAAAEVAVLVMGETGVGKTTIASEIHRLSKRADRPLVRVSCVALSHAGGEEELAGRGNTPGLLERAHRATLLLDGVEELALPLQPRVLRALESREVVRVGDAAPRTVDVRIVATGASDLADCVEDGALRRDLYYRLAATCIVVPALRARPADLAPLARHFVSRAREQAGRGPMRIGDDVLRWLAGQSFFGNVRELANAMEMAALLSSGDDLALDEVMRALARPTAVSTERAERRRGTASALAGELAEVERAGIIEALEACGGNQTRAAKMLGISRRTLVARLDEYALPRPLKGRK